MRQLLAIAALAALPAFPLLAEDQPAPGIALPAIHVTPVTMQDLTQRLIVTGLIAAVEEVQVQPLIEGQPIEELRADIGDYVETGAVLAVLSSSSLDLQRAQSLAGLAQAKAAIAQSEAQQIEARAARDEAKRVSERTARLEAQGTATSAASDSASAALQAAEARVDLAHETLAAAQAQADLAAAQLANVDLMLTRTEVTAPYGGRITARNATIGAVASAQGMPMFVLEKDGALELRADVPEAALPALRAGQAVHLRAAGLADMPGGTMRLIEPAIDTTTRQGRARISLPPEPSLRTGMFAEATITLAQDHLPAVPLSAISSKEGGEMLLRIRGGIVEEIPVVVMIRDQGFAGLAAGDLQPGDLVVTRAGAFIRPGEKVNPVTGASPAAAPAPKNPAPREPASPTPAQ
ncbi:efflux RND transporter periplasmic adaptor subunit [Rhodobacter sp. 24-YEA-8]|uniref:efflux RND transporter periplasmic adaptor subunit n=1 Tax=Rhodobacter sp. 24-YEA-8 TaxID=1884310 RepID=UPI00089881E9|nr:efflux RND transporter periplasmic adaptor subunit [Rhodobacter sp. 24-YEA-8]SEB98199.1 HlyD family secretion protein [Rhodobacter sp. 24-YEA-8]